MEVKGSVKARWGKLTDDDLDVMAGQRDQLVGKIQEKYGIAKDAAQRQVEGWNRTLDQESEYQRERNAERKAS